MQPSQKKLSVKLAKNGRKNIWSVKVGVYHSVISHQSEKAFASKFFVVITHLDLPTKCQLQQ